MSNNVRRTVLESVGSATLRRASSAVAVCVGFWACRGPTVGPPLLGSAGDSNATGGAPDAGTTGASANGGTSGAKGGSGAVGGSTIGGSPGQSGANGSGGTTGGSGGTTGGTGGITGGTGGTSGGTGGVTGGTGGTGGVTGGTGGTTGGAGGTTGGTSGTGGTGGTLCTPDAVRGACPSPEVCSGGTWIPYTALQCDACGIVSCPVGYANCCSGFRAGALTAGTFQPNPAAIKSFSVGSTSATATFQFGQAYEIGSIDLLLPFEVPIQSLVINYSYTGNVYSDFSLETGIGKVGGTYWDDVTYGDVDLLYPVSCFPQSTSCPTATVDQINVRLRPLGAGTATLTVTAIFIGN